MPKSLYISRFVGLMLIIICMNSFAFDLIANGDFEINRNYINLKSIGNKHGFNTYCGWSNQTLKMSPNKQLILSTRCFYRENSQRDNIFFFTVFDLKNKTYAIYEDAWSFHVNWKDNETLIFLKPVDTFIKAKLDILEFNIKTFEKRKYSLSNSVEPDGLEAVWIDSFTYSAPYVNIFYDSPGISGNVKGAYSVNIKDANDYMFLNWFFPDIDKDVRFPVNPHTKRVVIYPTLYDVLRIGNAFGFPARPYWQTSYDFKDPIYIEEISERIIIIDFENIYKENHIDGWGKLNLNWGRVESKHDLSGQATLEFANGTFFLSVAVEDENIIYKSGGDINQDYIDLWLHFKNDDESTKSSSRTYHLGLFLGEDSPIFIDHGRSKNKQDNPSFLSELSKIKVSKKVLNTGYRMEVELPVRFFSNNFNTVCYQINVIDVDSDHQEALITSNSDITNRYIWGKTDNFNCIPYMFASKSGDSF